MSDLAQFNIYILKNWGEFRANWLAGLTSNRDYLLRQLIVAFIWGCEELLAYSQKGVSKLNAYGGLFR
jgi:hypothetical protein